MQGAEGISRNVEGKFIVLKRNILVLHWPRDSSQGQRDFKYSKPFQTRSKIVKMILCFARRGNPAMNCGANAASHPLFPPFPPVKQNALSQKKTERTENRQLSRAGFDEAAQ